jgi:hypothetical protein
MSVNELCTKIWQVAQLIRIPRMEGNMDMFGHVKNVVRELIDISLVLIALAIVLSILVGGTLPFFGNVVTNLTDLVGKLGSSGLVGLIVLGVILWLFSGRGGTAAARK